jgi:hypothetical protein
MSVAQFVALPLVESRQSMRVNISDISRYEVYDRYRPGNGSLVTLKNGTRIHTTSTPEQIDEAIS